MVCIPCIVIPVVLWIFHKFIQPFILKFWNPWKKTITENKENNLSEQDKESESYAYIKKRITEESVIVFTKANCLYSDMAKDVFSKLKLKYAIEEIDKREDCKQLQEIFQKMTGESTVPRVFIGGKCIGGGTDVFTLYNENRLLPMLQEADASFLSD